MSTIRTLGILTWMSVSVFAHGAVAQPALSIDETAIQPGEDVEATFYGASLALSGDVAAVGAPNAGTSGAVFLLRRDAAGWTEIVRLASASPMEGERFGHAVALTGDTLLVGAPFGLTPPSESPGSVLEFTRTDAGWVETARLSPPAGSIGSRFGWSIALVGEGLALVGAPAIGAYSGSVFVFRRIGDTWDRALVLEPGGLPPGADYGAALAIDGDVLMVGAPGYDDPGVMRTPAGAVYAYEEVGGRWESLGMLRSSDIADRDEFGDSIALRGTTALISSIGDDAEASTYAGAVYVFERDGDRFTETAKWTAPTRVAYAFYGWSLAIGADVAFVGAPAGVEAPDDTARVYPYARAVGGWVPLAPIEPEGMARFGAFGLALALVGDTLLAGEPARAQAWSYDLLRSCTTDGDCADGNECTADVCTSSRCVYTAIDGCGEASDGGVSAPDAGTDGGRRGDAGPLVDAGAGSDGGPSDGGSGRTSDGGCGCTVAAPRAAPFASALLLAPLLALAARRRSRQV